MAYFLSKAPVQARAGYFLSKTPADSTRSYFLYKTPADSTRGYLLSFYLLSKTTARYWIPRGRFH